ncbi:MAG: hypothetical protein ACXVB4_09240 [Pseudobdellovibrionaceae bacterium]
MLSFERLGIKSLSKKNGFTKGFTIVELLIGFAGMAVLAGLFASSIMDLKVSENEFVDKNDALLFVNSLTTSILGSQDKCSTLFSGTVLPLPGATPVPFILNGYSGYGGNGAPLQGGTVITGTTANIGLRIKSLTIEAKNIPDTFIVSGGVNYTRRIAVLNIALERRQRKFSTIFMDLPPRFVEFPVYVNAGGAIASCQLEMQPIDVCDMIGATLLGGVCKPAVQCQLKGTYVTSICSPAYGGCPPSIANPVTGDATCPAGATATKTGEVAGNFNVSCGKKCSYNVTNNIYYFICMQCN